MKRDAASHDHVKMDGYKTVEQKFDPDGKNIPVSITPEKQ
jgi:hypothetical protein